MLIFRDDSLRCAQVIGQLAKRTSNNNCPQPQAVLQESEQASSQQHGRDKNEKQRLVAMSPIGKLSLSELESFKWEQHLANTRNTTYTRGLNNDSNRLEYR